MTRDIYNKVGMRARTQTKVANLETR